MLQTLIVFLNLRMSNIMVMLFDVFKTEQKNKTDMPTKSSENLYYLIRAPIFNRDDEIGIQQGKKKQQGSWDTQRISFPEIISFESQ